MRIAVIGGGPAGLRAAEVAATDGARVTLFDAKPSVGRKLLVAGRGGLNLSKAEPPEQFAGHYGGGAGMPPETWSAMLAGFGLEALREWTAGLGIETFAASTGRVYPRDLKAAPLLRRWVERLHRLGVTFAMKHRWSGLEPGPPLRLRFATETGETMAEADAAIFALGGASWPGTGSDGGWVPLMEAHGVAVAPLRPANNGWETPWPPSVLEAAEGLPLKNIALRAGGRQVRGELLLTRYGLEGGALYQLGAILREMPGPEVAIDFKPEGSAERLLARLGGAVSVERAAAAWRLSPAAAALLRSREPYRDAAALVAEARRFRVALSGPRPIEEAISSAGGIRWPEVDATLQLRRLPGCFVAGEMLDWEAPTGGYLIHGCLASGTHAARGALATGKAAPPAAARNTQGS